MKVLIQDDVIYEYNTDNVTISILSYVCKQVYVLSEKSHEFHGGIQHGEVQKPHTIAGERIFLKQENRRQK